ncbi:hypothetical protein CDV36_004701 [Fusarium kuroshium]|uniref:C2H2-type domain-containing protein n=1 Tax=Fusarium kuroshium TaxID=2010991 RepID=A0A3M2SDK6_9HYPO|nr:hypothetical protein CDV36_004701 [Fusarium kuroshium]
MARQSQLYTPHSTSTSQVAIRNAPTCGMASRHLARSTTHPSPRSSRTTTPTRTWVSTATASLSSEEEWDSSSSSSGSDSDSEEDDQAEDYTLPQEHQWHRFRPELLQLAHTQLREFRSGVQYDASPRTRSRVVKWQPEPFMFEEAQDPNDPELVVLSRQRKMRRQFHNACPFYASDPVKYKQCLLLCNRKSIEGLIDHLTRHHIKPLYCARCSETFETPVSRDRHILDEKCQLLDPKPMDGIDQYQRNRLWKRDRWYLDERRRWRRMWTTVFPSQPPRSPYLDQGLGLEVSMARDFWETYGWQCVSEFLSSRGCLDECNGDDDRARNALCDLALADLLKDIIDGCPTAGTC